MQLLLWFAIKSDGDIWIIYSAILYSVLKYNTVPLTESSGDTEIRSSSDALNPKLWFHLLPSNNHSTFSFWFIY